MTEPLAVPAPTAPAAVPRDPSLGSAMVPAVVAGAGDRAARRFLEFFAATIRNPNTRAAYHRGRASRRFDALIGTAPPLRRELRIDASNLPGLTPSRDLWSGIAERIDAPVIPLPTGEFAATRRGEYW